MICDRTETGSPTSGGRGEDQNGKDRDEIDMLVISLGENAMSINEFAQMKKMFVFWTPYGHTRHQHHTALQSRAKLSSLEDAGTEYLRCRSIK